MGKLGLTEIDVQYQKDIKAAEEHCLNTNKQYPKHTTFHAMQRNKAYNALEKVKADYQRKIKNHSKIVPLLRKAGLPIASSSTTAIRGHKEYTLGFKISSDSEGVRIYFQSQGYASLSTYRELSVEQKSLAVKVLIEAGYSIEATNSEIKILSFNWG